MSISTQARSAPLSTSNNWNIWRMFNSLIIIFSFFVPWIIALGNKKDINNAVVNNGFQLLNFLQYMTRFHNSLFERNWLERIQAVIGSPLIMGLIAILIYCVQNLLMAAFKIKLVTTPIWIILAYFLLALGIRCLWALPTNGVDFENWYKGFSYMLFGYWIVLFGLVSSAVQETSFFLSRRNFSEITEY